MISRWIILLLLVNIPFGQNVIGEGLYENELIEFLQSNYMTSTTLGYDDARDTLDDILNNEDIGFNEKNTAEELMGFVSQKLGI